MHEQVQEKLLAINRSFYGQFARPFAQSRANPQPGFARAVAAIGAHSKRILDVGCGEGRFGRFLWAQRPQVAYTGVDFSANLLESARQSLPDATFLQRDIAEPGCLDDLGQYDAVICLAVLQHIPGRHNRARLLQEMGRRLAPQAPLIVSTWQFLESERQRKKIVAWAAGDLAPEEVEEGDYLLSWRSGGFGLRYVAAIDQAEMAHLARQADLTVAESFRSDGKEGNLNLYTVLRQDGASLAT